MAKQIRTASENQRNIVNLIQSLTGKYNGWQIWQDFIYMAAVAISNRVDIRHRDEREASYLNLVQKYSPKEMETFTQIFAEVVMEMDRNPNQDVLGELFMNLNLGNCWKGQFFTPYNICRLMAAINVSDETAQQVETQGWISINDPACGAGALLIAYANECKAKKINYQQHILFVGQDIDFTAGLMCYIQLSLLGCPGYVVIRDTLIHPVTSRDECGLIPVDEGHIWYTPMYFSKVWTVRRMITSLKMEVA